MKKILSVALMIVMLLGLMQGFVASAESGYLQIGANATYGVEWTAAEEKAVLLLTVEETGFYDLYIDDKYETYSLDVELYPNDGADNTIYDTTHWFNDAVEEYDYTNLYLQRNREYRINLGYIDYAAEEAEYRNGSVDISFTKSDYVPSTMAMGSSCYFYEGNGLQWIEFRTAGAGDYLFDTSEIIYGWCYIFEKGSGEYVTSFYHEEYTRSRVSLKAQTDYLVIVDLYDPYYCYTEMSFRKAEKNIVDIQIEQSMVILANHYAYIAPDYAELSADPSDFAYRVTYSDRSQEILWNTDLLQLGAQITSISYEGEVQTIPSEYYDQYLLAVGNQPVLLWSGSRSFESSIYITPYLKWLQDDEISITTDYEPMKIEYENDEEQGYCWRICPDENNMYNIYSTDWEEITIYSFNIFDKDNNVVSYTPQGWRLTGGEEYALDINYIYNEGCYDNVDFELRPDESHRHSYGSYVYNNDATSTKDGTKTRTCSVCKATETVTAPGTKLQNPFKDVKAGQYYTEPVLWAVGQGITNGTSATTFAPNATCTRGQIVTFLWRAAGSPEPQSTRNPFKDVKSNQYYYKAVLWAVEKGITTGTSATTFSPDAACTRGQVVTFLWRAKGKPAASGSNAFRDVKSGAYYYDAVRWAVKNGVTTGMSATSFAPDSPCTRGQIVTFLYRAYN